MTTRPTVKGHAIMADLPRQNPRALAQNRTSFARSDCWGSAITSPAAAVNVRRAAPPLPFAGSFHGDAAPVERAAGGGDGSSASANGFTWISASRDRALRL